MEVEEKPEVTEVVEALRNRSHGTEKLRSFPRRKVATFS